jgi:HAD superfamily hydrolase (TIGR01549 family)
VWTVPEAVLFDYGLTLVTFDFPSRCLARMLESFRPRLAEATGRAAPPAETLVADPLLKIEEALPDFGTDEIDYLDFYRRGWSGAGWNLPDDLLYDILDAEQRCWDRAVQLAPDAISVLLALRESGLKTAIFSNAPFPPEFLHRQVRDNGLAGAVDAAVFSSEIGKRKPAPEAYLAALGRIHADPASTLHVGDRFVEDYEGPRRLGMEAVICTALARSPAPPGTPSIGSLSELLALV